MLFTGRPGRAAPGLRWLARLAAGDGPRRPRPTELRALLLPLVSRALRTGRGPAGLLHWIGRTADPWPPDDRMEHEERALTDVLAYLLLETPDPHTETRRDD
jgi:hypothetical protein